jgi:hypothetical protein
VDLQQAGSCRPVCEWRSLCRRARDHHRDQPATHNLFTLPERLRQESPYGQCPDLARSDALNKSWRREIGQEARWLKALQARAEGKTYKQSGIEAGYPPKNAAQCAFQAINGLRGRVSEVLNNAGLSEQIGIEKHLKPATRGDSDNLRAEER